MEQITKCPKCGADIKVVPSGISKRTGKPYSSFLSCSNRDCDYTARLTDKPQNTGDQMIMEELAGINARLDKLIAYVVEKLK